MGDKIDKLPIDNTASSSKSDIEMIGALFQSKETVTKVTYEFKDAIVGGVLFAILSSSLFDNMIRSSGCGNNTYVWAIKILVFIILFYILKNRF